MHPAWVYVRYRQCRSQNGNAGADTGHPQDSDRLSGRWHHGRSRNRSREGEKVTMHPKRVAILLPAVLVTCFAFAQEKGAIHFTAITQNVSGAGESIKINLSNWSTDTQRD